MNLDLSAEQARDLKAALELHLRELLEELAHTDDRKYRADLRATLERLEEVRRRLGAGPTPP